MAENVIQTRIQLKYDTLVNWNASLLVPKKGEACIAEIPSATTGSGLTPPAIGIKIGDGEHVFSQLPWIQAVAGDVYAWAKASTKPTYAGTEITAVQNGTTNTTVQAWLQALSDDINSISGGAGSISTQISNALNNLDAPDAAVDHEFVTAVAEEDGRITVSRAALTANDIPNLPTTKITSGTLPVARGGTGASTLASGEVLVGNGTNAVTTKAIDAAVTSGSNNLITSGAVQAAIATATSGLTGAMHFKGIATVEITDGSTTDPAIDGYLSKTAGDVVLYGNKEFVWTGTAWEELGNEGSYALSTVTITAGEGLTGGGTLETDRSISHNQPTGASAGTRGDTDDSKRTYIKTITTDKFGHVTGVTTKEETVQNTTYTFAEGTTNGAFSVTPSGGTAQSVPVHGLNNAAYKNVDATITNGTTSTNVPTSAAVASYVNTQLNNYTTSIYELDEASSAIVSGETIKYLVFDCGNSTEDWSTPSGS